MSQTPTHPGHATLHHDPQAAANAVAAYEESRLRELAQSQRWRNRAWTTGRVLLGALFLATALGKVVSFRATETAMSDYGLQLTGLLLAVAIAIEAAGGALLVLGLKTREAAVALCVWLFTVTLVVHGNLTLDANRVQVANNLAIIAALFFLYAHGGGGASLDQARARREAQQA